MLFLRQFLFMYLIWILIIFEAFLRTSGSSNLLTRRFIISYSQVKESDAYCCFVLNKVVFYSLALVPAGLVHELKQGINAVLHDPLELEGTISLIDEVVSLVSLVCAEVY